MVQEYPGKFCFIMVLVSKIVEYRTSSADSSKPPTKRSTSSTLTQIFMSGFLGFYHVLIFEIFFHVGIFGTSLSGLVFSWTSHPPYHKWPAVLAQCSRGRSWRAFSKTSPQIAHIIPSSWSNKEEIDELASLMHVPTLCMVQDHDLYLFGC